VVHGRNDSDPSAFLVFFVLFVVIRVFFRTAVWRQSEFEEQQ
jgi:hypothetical protein